MKRIVIVPIGPPLSGKGTLGRALAEELGVRNMVEMSQVIRDNLDKLPFGCREKIEAGHLLDDENACRLWVSKINSVFPADSPPESILLDGFPRTLVQMEALRQHFYRRRFKQHQVHFFLLNVREKICEDRLAGRQSVEGRADDNRNSLYRQINEWRRHGLQVRHQIEWRFMAPGGVRIHKINAEFSPEMVLEQALNSMQEASSKKLP